MLVSPQCIKPLVILSVLPNPWVRPSGRVLPFFLVFAEGLGWLRGSSMGVCEVSVTCLRVKRAIQINVDLI